MSIKARSRSHMATAAVFSHLWIRHTRKPHLGSDQLSLHHHLYVCTRKAQLGLAYFVRHLRRCRTPSFRTNSRISRAFSGLFYTSLARERGGYIAESDVAAFQPGALLGTAVVEPALLIDILQYCPARDQRCWQCRSTNGSLLPSLHSM